jgi:DNA topoisomerase-1
MSALIDPVGDLTTTQVFSVVQKIPTDATPDDHAAAVGLLHVSDEEPGITRQRRGTGFTYRYPDGTTVPRDHRDRLRAAALAIPPAWTDVWVCLEPAGHIQATGRDEAGRKQYRYHPRWQQIRGATKFHRMRLFAEVLPRIREHTDRALRIRSFSRDRMLALLTALLDETLLRVGNDEYLRTNGSYGLTTLEREHVQVAGSHIEFRFIGKSGQTQEIDLRNPRLARQLLRCEEIPGQRLFSFEDDTGWRDIDSSDVNGHLAEVAGAEVTAKDFRTWGATVVAAEALRELGPCDEQTEAEARWRAALDVAAERLGNTRDVARDSYVDPRVMRAYMAGSLDDAWDKDPKRKDWLSASERAVKRILEQPLRRG